MTGRIFALVFSLSLAAPAWAAGAPPAAPVPTGIPAYSALNVKDFLVACKADRASCIDEVGSALMDKMVLDGNSSVCIDSVDYGAPVPGWLSAHPQTAAMPAEDGIYTALRALYPC